MPTTSQLVRKGRKPKPRKMATPGLKSGKGNKTLSGYNVPAL